MPNDATPPRSHPIHNNKKHVILPHAYTPIGTRIALEKIIASEAARISSLLVYRASEPAMNPATMIMMPRNKM